MQSVPEHDVKFESKQSRLHGRRGSRNRENIIEKAKALAMMKHSRGKGLDSEEVDLDSTLQRFGFSRGFEVQTYLREHFSQHSPSTASAHMERLMQRRKLTSDALKKYVTVHYKNFISTSKEIIHIETNMLKLTNMLNDYRVCLKSLQEVSFAFPEKNRSSKREEKKRLRHTTKALAKEVALEELAEDLRGLIYERKFDKAVRAVELAYEGKSISRFTEQEHSFAPIREQIAELIDTLAADLRSATLKKYERRQIIAYLVRLGAENRALRIFLQTKSREIKSKVRQIKFQGDASVYVGDLSQIVLQGISSSCTDFHRLFRNDKSMMSGVIVWAIEELENFGQIFQKQVLQSNDMFGKLGICLRFAFNACWALEKKGLSLLFVMARIFKPTLFGVIQRNFKHVEQLIAESLQQEEWIVKWIRKTSDEDKSNSPRSNNDRKNDKQAKRSVKLTTSAHSLYEIVGKLLKDLAPILDINKIYPGFTTVLYPILIQGTVRLFQGYLLHMAQQAKAGVKTLDDKQHLSIIANAFYLGDDLLPRLNQSFSTRFDRPVPELEELKTKILRLHRALLDSYCHKRASVWAADILRWRSGASTNYYNGDTELDPSTARPLSVWRYMVKYLNGLKEGVVATLGTDSIVTVLQLAVEELLRTLCEPECWDGIQISRQGLLQLSLDIAFFLRACQEYTHSESIKLGQTMISKATEALSSSEPSSQVNLDIDDLLSQANEWISQAATREVDKMQASDAKSDDRKKLRRGRNRRGLGGLKMHKKKRSDRNLPPPPPGDASQNPSQSPSLSSSSSSSSSPSNTVPKKKPNFRERRRKKKKIVPPPTDPPDEG